MFCLLSQLCLHASFRDSQHEKSGETEPALTSPGMESCDLTVETRRLLGLGAEYQAPCPGRKRRAAR